MNRALANRTDANYLADIRAGADYLRQHESVASGGVGILGFCSGGRRALLYAAQFEGVKAVVSFHAASMTTPAEVTRVSVPTQLHHGTGDRVSPPGVSQALADQLKSQGTPVEVFLYEGADHGFLAYTREPEYNPDAAQLAWSRTIAFLRRHLPAWKTEDALLSRSQFLPWHAIRRRQQKGHILELCAADDETPGDRPPNAGAAAGEVGRPARRVTNHETEPGRFGIANHGDVGARIEEPVQPWEPVEESQPANQL